MEGVEMNWENKRVLVTGHTGFKGSWLSLWLQEKGARVCGFAHKPPTIPNMFSEAHIEDGMQSSIVGDVRDPIHLIDTFLKFKPEIVFHLAAQPIVSRSYKDPLETYSTNVMGTVNVLEAVMMADSVRSVVVVTSDKCYENQQWDWPYRESDRLGGHDPYSASKACVELIVLSYRDSFFKPQRRVNIATVRAGNVIGGGDWGQDRLIPDIMRAWSAGKTVTIRNPNSVRPWQFVLDPLRGYIELAECLYEHGPDWAEAWNFGPEQSDAWEVLEIVDHLKKYWGEDAKWELSPVTFGETKILTLDWSKARRRLLWHPRVRMESALVQTAAWYKAWKQGKDMREFTLDQIRSYE